MRKGLFQAPVFKHRGSRFSVLSVSSVVRASWFRLCRVEHGWLLVFCSAAVIAAAADNLAPNPGFEKGSRAPDGWAAPDSITTFWDRAGGHPGRCLRLNTNVPAGAAGRGGPAPSAPANAYATAGAHEGAGLWSAPIPVKRGQWYLMAADVQGPPGSQPILFLRGFRRCTEAEAAASGTLGFFAPVPGAGAFSDPIFGTDPRRPRAGDQLQRFRASLFCDIPKDTRAGQWTHVERVVQIKASGSFAADTVLLRPFAYWPPGTYRFDSLTLTPISAAAATAFKSKIRLYAHPPARRTPEE